MVAYLDVELVPTQDVLKNMKQANRLEPPPGDAQTKNRKGLIF